MKYIKTFENISKEESLRALDQKSRIEKFKG